MTIQWQTSPSVLTQGINEYAGRAMAALKELGERSAVELQNNARQGAPWQDRTGNARNGLFGSSEQTGGQVDIVLAHTVKYGPVLELGHGAKYAVIMPTITNYLPSLAKTLDGMFKG